MASWTPVSQSTNEVCSQGIQSKALPHRRTMDAMGYIKDLSPLLPALLCSSFFALTVSLSQVNSRRPLLSLQADQCCNMDLQSRYRSPSKQALLFRTSALDELGPVAIWLAGMKTALSLHFTLFLHFLGCASLSLPPFRFRPSCYFFSPYHYLPLFAIVLDLILFLHVTFFPH